MTLAKGHVIPTHSEVEVDLALLENPRKTLDRLLAAKSIHMDAVPAELKLHVSGPVLPTPP